MKYVGPITDPSAPVKQSQLAGYTRRSTKRMALFGDSLSEKNTSRGQSYSRGFMTFAQQMSGHRVYFDSSLNFGIGGQNSTQIAARVGTVIAAAPDIVLVEMGGNDTGDTGTTAATTINNIKTVCQALSAAGIFVILFNLYPTASNTTAATLKKVAQINQWIMDAPFLYNTVEVVDIHKIMFDNTTSLVRPSYTFDFTHPGAYGAWFIGSALSDKIKQMIPAERHVALENMQDKWDSTDFTTGNILVNPQYSGSGGTVYGSGGSGTIPAGLVLNMQLANGATAVLATIAGADGFNTVEITLGGTTGAAAISYNTVGHLLLSEYFGGTVAWNTTALGTYLRNTAVNHLLQLEVEVENLVGVMAVGMETYQLFDGGANQVPSNGDGLLFGGTGQPSTVALSESMPTVSGTTKLTLRAEPEANGGQSNGYWVGLHANFLPGTAISGKIRISRPVFRAYPTKFI